MMTSKEIDEIIESMRFIDPWTEQCRFCMQNDLIENMKSPCDCSGSIKYVHVKCIEKWGSDYCPVCKEKYHTVREFSLESFLIKAFCLLVLYCGVVNVLRSWYIITIAVYLFPTLCAARDIDDVSNVITIQLRKSRSIVGFIVKLCFDALMGSTYIENKGMTKKT